MKSIVISGAQASGKTYTAKNICKTFGFNIIFCTDCNMTSIEEAVISAKSFYVRTRVYSAIILDGNSILEFDTFNKFSILQTVMIREPYAKDKSKFIVPVMILCTIQDVKKEDFCNSLIIKL